MVLGSIFYLYVLLQFQSPKLYTFFNCIFRAEFRVWHSEIHFGLVLHRTYIWDFWIINKYDRSKICTYQILHLSKFALTKQCKWWAVKILQLTICTVWLFNFWIQIKIPSGHSVRTELDCRTPSGCLENWRTGWCWGANYTFGARNVSKSAERGKGTPSHFKNTSLTFLLPPLWPELRHTTFLYGLGKLAIKSAENVRWENGSYFGKIQNRLRG